MKLVESNHVTDVKEIIDCGNHTIMGKVLPQTRVNSAPYEVKIELQDNRSISKSHCGCKAGLSQRGCKHVAAVCIYVNEECTTSKTDQPLMWNRPSVSQFEKYKKGCTIANLIPPKIVALGQSQSVDDVKNVSEEYLSIECSFTKHLNTEKITESERLLSRQKEKMRIAEIRRVCGILYEFQSDMAYHCYDCSMHDEGCKVSLKRLKCPEELQNSFKNIKVTKDEWIRICVESESQSECFSWFAERAKGITCSKKAHQIKTRKTNFETLASQFKRDKFRDQMTPAMEYGIKTESIARDFFSTYTGLKVYTIGLIIRMAQPFLATSADGIILDDESLLEIKCPYTCENKKIVDSRTRTCNVPYLVFNAEGVVELKQAHQYYTQVQISMYVIGLRKCHFFVYSRLDYVHLEIEINDLFLSEYIPKMEMFYFKYFLPVLF